MQIDIYQIYDILFLSIQVVRAVNEANRKRAKMTLRHQRNITITGLLVAVVIVFLVCHSLKLLLNCYEVNTERPIILAVS